MDRIIRINPLLEALKSASGRVNKVFIQEEKGHARIGEVIREAKARHVPCVFVPARRLDLVAPGHQGVMAEVSPKGYASLGDILARSASPSSSFSTRSRTPRTSAPSSAAPRGQGSTASSCPSGARPA